MSATGRVPPAGIAIDVGQTGMRASWVADGERVLRQRRHGVKAVVSAEAVDELTGVVAELIDGAGAGRSIAIGLSGFAVGSRFPRTFGEAVASRTAAANVIVASDVVTAYVGTVGDERGGVLICGTGSVALGWGEHGWRRVDGRGHVLGDLGSGYWIGREGLLAALNHADGRGGSARLLQRAERLGSPEVIYAESHTAPSIAQYVAGFARDVIEEAVAGEPAAVDIVDRAVVELAATAIAAAPDGGAIGLTGGLVNARYVSDRLAAAIRSERPGVPLVVVADASLAGAERLVCSAAAAADRFPGLVHIVEGVQP